jgi:large subunit ribosomal protein L22
MEATAKARNIKGSSQKMKLVVDLVRGMLVKDATYTLDFSGKRAALPVKKVIEAAVANAEVIAERDNISVDSDTLWIKAIYVGKGITKHRRRVRPAPMGRAYREQRHYSHLTVVVSSDARADKKAKKAAKA